MALLDGLIPAPNDPSLFLCSDGTWKEPNITDYFLTSSGLWTPAIEEYIFLRGDAQWTKMDLMDLNPVPRDINVYLYDNETLYFTHNDVKDHGSHTLTNSWVIAPDSVYSGWVPAPWASNRENITTIISDRVVAPKSCAYLFYSCTALTDISGLSNWTTSLVTRMDSMFQLCTSIPSFAALNKWDVSNVTSHTNTFASTTGTRPSWGVNW